MSLSVPLSLLQFPGYFTDLDGQPLSAGTLLFYIAGTTTPGDVFADNQGVGSLTNPVVLDDSGFAAVFLSSAYLYDVVVSDSDANELYTREGVGNPAQIAFAGLGNIQTQGSKNVTSGYSILSTDNFVTVASTGGANPCVINLPSAATRSPVANGNGMMLVIKNLGTVPLSLVPSGADTFETIAAPYAVPGASSPLFPTVQIDSDATSALWVMGGIGV